MNARMRKALRGWRFWAVVALAGGLFATAAWPRDMRLLARATRVATLDADGTSYWWISDREILTLPNADSYYSMVLTPVYANGPTDQPGVRDPRDAQRIDVIAGTRTPLPGLTRAIDRTCSKATTRFIDDSLPMADFKLSPDGKWLLWTTYDPAGQWFVHACQTDGTRYTRWRRASLSSLFWRPNSHQWIELDSWSSDAAHLAIHDMAVPPTTAEAPAPMDASDSRWLPLQHAGLARGDRLVADDRHWEPSDAVIAGERSDRTDIWEIGLSPGSPPPRKHIIQAPYGASIEATVYSPLVDRVAWILKGPLPPRLPTFVYRLFPQLRSRPQEVVSLWVSRIDGSGMHMVGYEEVRKDEAPILDSYGAAKLRWMPDGKRLSFLYKDALYTVPAD